MSEMWLYTFEKGDKLDKGLLGGKGANLAGMTQLGLPVPPGFTITTRACNAYVEHGEFPAGLWDQTQAAVAELEGKLGKRFGGVDDPLLFSVRSGAKFSMPGMMDTILNLGLNDATCEGLVKKTGNPRFAKDSYRRLIQTFRRRGAGRGAASCSSMSCSPCAARARTSRSRRRSWTA